MDRETEFLAAEFDRALFFWCASGKPARVRYVARLLRERGAWPLLVQDWTAADEQGDGDAACRMGWVLLDDQAGSEQAFARAAQRDNLSALSREMRRHRESGHDITELEKRYREVERGQQQADEHADKRGDAQAAYRIGERLIRQWKAYDRERYSIYKSLSLGVATPSERARYDSIMSREERDRAAQLRRAGEAALRRAAERGSADAAADLGDLVYNEHRDGLSDKERGKRALPWYRRADELGHPAGTWRLGMILKERGDAAGAEAALRRAESRGHPLAPSTLALLLRHRTPPDWDGAEAAYRRGAEIGYDVRGWTELANFLEERGDLRGAEAAYQDAVKHREGQAEAGLRYFYEDHPDLKPADTFGTGPCCHEEEC